MIQTPNYNLPQFTSTDKFTKEDFNDAFSKVDEGMSYLQEVINNASGNAGVTAQEVINARKGEASLVKKIEKIDTSVVEINTHLAEKSQQIDERIFGQSGKKIKMLAGVIRNSGTGWEYIVDTGHDKTNFSTVEILNGSVKVNYSYMASKVNSLVCTPDETFSKYGLICGASVGKDSSLIDLCFPLEFICGINNGVYSFINDVWFNDELSAIAKSDGTGLTITHPRVESKDVPVVQLGTYNPQVDLKVSKSATTLEVTSMCDLYGQVYYDTTTSTWKIDTECVANVTFGFASGVLTVTHDGTFNPHIYNISCINRGSYTTRIDWINKTYFQVKFYDNAGTQIMTPDTNMKFYFNRPGCKVKCLIPNTSFYVKRGYVKADANKVINQYANIWMLGEMEII